MVNKQYDQEKLSQKFVLILQFTDDAMSLQKNEEEDFNDDSETDTAKLKIGSQETAYKLFFHKILMSLRGVRLLNTELGKPKFTSQRDTSTFFFISKKLGTDSIEYKFYVPHREVLQSQDIETDIVVVVNKMVFGRYTEDTGPGYLPGYVVHTPGGTMTTGGSWTGGGPSKFLHASFEYVIYDYDQQAVITYGASHITAGLGNMIIGSNQMCFEKIAYEIFKHSPFTWKEKTYFESN